MESTHVAEQSSAAESNYNQLQTAILSVWMEYCFLALGLQHIVRQFSKEIVKALHAGTFNVLYISCSKLDLSKSD